MNTLWTAHIANSPSDKKDFEQQLLHSRAILDRLTTIIEDLERSITNIELSLSTYETSSWSHKQAHLNGLKAAYSNIKSLTEDTKG